MKTLEQRYSEYRRELSRLNEQKDAQYAIASQKFSQGDKDGQAKAYDEVDAIQAKIDALVNPIEAGDQLLGESEGLL